jgi:tetratricopeptide (TPR) repeat protein
MEEGRRERLKEVLLLLQSQPAAGRRAWVELRLQDDPELAREVLSLIETRTPGLEARLEPLVEPPPGLRVEQLLPKRIGRYRIDALIGQGGSSFVYRAHVDEPVQRTVAVKVLRCGPNARELLARFDVERAVIAKLEHRNIARLLDAGSDDEERPWLAMELVDGPTITDYVKLHALSLTQRLALVRQVCHAVQHAHDRGVLHRDIKPSNILVAEEDGAPVPKVIDFGLAKILRPELERGVQTSGGQVLGTLGYMSPEQSDPHHSDVDVRADVYAIGVLLYEVLTGTTPFARERWEGLSAAAIHSVLMRERPEPPSHRMAPRAQGPSYGAPLPTVPRELDCIVLKALEPDRSQRYSRVSALTEDLERLERGELVSARPPTTAYRLWTFVRRHRLAIAVASMVFAMLLAGLAATTVGFRRAVQERERAELERDRADRAARDHEEFALLIRRYALTPRQGSNASFRDVIVRGATDFVAAPPESVTVRARLAQALGEALFHLGEEARARELLTMAVRDFEDPRFDEENAPYRGPLLFTALTRLASLARSSGSEEDAADHWASALRAGSTLGGVDASLYLPAMASYADTLVGLGRFEEAERLARDALERSRALATSSSFESLLLSGLGNVLAKSGRTDEGLEKTRAAWELRTGAGSQSALFTVMLGVVHGSALLRAGRAGESEAHLAEVLSIARSALGPTHPDTLTTLALHARAHARAFGSNDLASAISTAIDELGARDDPLSRRGRQVLTYAIDAHLAVGAFESAAHETDALIARAEHGSGPTARSTAMLRWELGTLWGRAGVLDRARELLERARADLAATLPPEATALVLLAAELEELQGR